MASMLEKLLGKLDLLPSATSCFRHGTLITRSDGRRKKLSTGVDHTTVPSKRKYAGQSETFDKVTPSEDQMDQFVARLVAKTPTSTAGNFAFEQRSDGSSFVDTGFNVGDGLNTFDFNFDFGAYDDPFADIMRMTEASLAGNAALKNPALWPWN